mgnify:FL=1
MNEDKMVEALIGIRVEVNGIRKVLQLYFVITLIFIVFSVAMII